MAAKVNEEICIGCGSCESVCPVGAITILAAKAKIDDACIECGACESECPVEAISLMAEAPDKPEPENNSQQPVKTGDTGNRRHGRGQGRGRGPAEACVCPKCGEKIEHTAGVPCASLKCPKCGSPLTGFWSR